MLNFVSKDKSQQRTGAYPNERNYDLSADLPMVLLNNRYFFLISNQGLSQDFAFDPFLFLTKEHLKTQSEDELLLFQLLDQKTDSIVAHLPFFIAENGLAYSPGRAPFGSVQFKHNLQEEVLAEFLERTKRYLLEEKNCHTIRIKSYPFAYAPAESAVLTDLLLKQNYQISHSEVNHHIVVEELPASFKMDSVSRRRLNKLCLQEFVFKEEGYDFLSIAFEFIQSCRIEKGYHLGITKEHITELFHNFPESFRIFSVEYKNTLAACTIAVQINNSILYNYSMASSKRFQSYSPSILLLDGLYNFCKKEKIKLLDLGTSNLPTGPNFPLIAFKKHMGGEPTLKLTFEFKK